MQVTLKSSEFNAMLLVKGVWTNFVTFGWCLEALYDKKNVKTLQKHARMKWLQDNPPSCMTQYKRW